MDAKSNPQVIPKTLAELIKQETPVAPMPPVSYPNDYEVYPEKHKYDLPLNPYSRV